MKKTLLAIGALAIGGLADSFYGLIQHYGPLGSGACNWGGRISCDLVNKSVFSEIAGLPVALIGVLGYAAIIIAAILVWKKNSRSGRRALLLLSLAGLLFSFYLTWIELWWLRAYCPICLVSQTLILLITLLALQLWRSLRTSAPESA